MNYIEIKDLTKYYGSIKGVENLNISVKKGEIFGFIGPNGAGKSTTIRCIMSLINKTSGTILIDGEEVSKENVNLREDIGYLPSEIHLYDDLTVKEMLDYSSSFYKKDCIKKIKDLVRRLEVDTTKNVDELSLGNSKKVGIIIALMHSPKLIIMDEATSGLDPLMQEEFFKILKEEREQGATIFFSSHTLSELKKICDRVGIIKNGKLIKVEDMNDLANHTFSVITLTSNDIKKIRKELEKEKIVSETEDTIKFMYKEDINKLVKLISAYKIDRLFIEEPTVEEIFMHYYK